MGSQDKLDEVGENQDSRSESLTIDEAVDKIYKGFNWKLLLVFITAVGSSYVTAAETYITIFTGFIPYNEWTCNSTKCDLLLADHQKENNSLEFFSKTSMCENNFKVGDDFIWTSKRSSFSMDWGFYCKTEGKLSVSSSFFFIGAFLGLLSSTAIFDMVGRRNGCIIGSVIAAAATLVGTWIPSYEAMLALRIFQGYGQFINFTGVYCWIIEFSPSHLRNSINAILLNCWAFGYLVMVLMGYLIPNWRYIFLAVGILNFVLITPLIIYPPSPRFSLVRGREKDAKRTLVFFSKICNNPVSFDTVTLTFTSRKQNFLEQLKDFKKYPQMRKITLLCMVCWFIVAALFYGFSFGWSKISDNLYVSYLFAALGKVIAFTILIPVCHLLGRKKSMLFWLVCGILSNFLAMPDVNINKDWTLEYVACLFGSIAISAAFAQIYLFTSELAPTSHRGMVMSLSSSAARVGSFMGTYINLLYNITDRRVPLALIAGVSLVCGVAVFFLPDTTGKRIMETPLEVESSGKKEYSAIEKQNQEL